MTTPLAAYEAAAKAMAAWWQENAAIVTSADDVDDVLARVAVDAAVSSITAAERERIAADVTALGEGWVAVQGWSRPQVSAIRHVCQMIVRRLLREEP